MARSLSELKRMINRYQDKYLLPNAAIKRANTVASSRLPLCFNCSQRGHIKPKCPYDQRPNGSGFRCWRMGHDHRSCPNPRKILKPLPDQPVNAVHYEDVVGLDNLDLVSIAFDIDRVRRAVFNSFIPAVQLVL